MSATLDTAASQQPNVRWKRIVLPPEHGAWGFLFEPIVAALALVPSASGVLIAISALAAFLARNPLRIVLSDRRMGVRSARTRHAGNAAMALGIVALASLALAIVTGKALFLVALACALPFAIVQQRLESMRRSRELAAELTGTIAVGSVASMIALAGGGSGWLALSLWIFVAARAIPAVLYVRSRIALDKRNLEPSLVPTLSHVVGFAAVTLLLATPGANVPATIVIALLLIRCICGLSNLRRPVPARKVGIGELFWGALLVLSLIAGYWR